MFRINLMFQKLLSFAINVTKLFPCRACDKQVILMSFLMLEFATLFLKALNIDFLILISVNVEMTQ